MRIDIYIWGGHNGLILKFECASRIWGFGATGGKRTVEIWTVNLGVGGALDSEGQLAPAPL